MSMTCKQCRNICECEDDAWRNDVEFDPDVSAKYCTGFEPETNADRIRAMSDEELAEWLVKQTVYQESAWSEPSYLNFLTNRDDTKERAIKGTVEWLKQPAEVEHE